MKFGGANHLAPLISFDTIFDLDIGLIQLIYSEFLDPKIFHIDFFQRNLIDIIKDIYEIALVKDCGMSEWKIYFFGGHLDSYIIKK